jgi:molecular chaperone DnaJ
VDVQEALAVLGLSPGVTLAEARAAYRRLVRVHHPDVAGDAATAQAARLTEAFAVLRSVASSSTTGTIDPVASPSVPAAPEPTTPSAAQAARGAYQHAAEAELAAGDTILVRAPADEAFVALLDGAARIGHIGYLDRQLGILETIVRFEDGPTCSLLITLQGRVEGTEAFCTIESIEAAPTPPIGPVVDALLKALADPRS